MSPASSGRPSRRSGEASGRGSGRGERRGRSCDRRTGVDLLAFSRRYLFRYALWYIGGIGALIATDLSRAVAVLFVMAMFAVILLLTR